MPDYKQTQGQAQFDCSEQSLQTFNQKLDEALKIPNLPIATSLYLSSLQFQQFPWKDFLSGRSIDFVLNIQNDKITTDQVIAHNKACKILNKIPGFAISNTNISGGIVVKISLSLSNDSKQTLQDILSRLDGHPLNQFKQNFWLNDDKPLMPADKTHYYKTNEPLNFQPKEQTSEPKQIPKPKLIPPQYFSKENSQIILEYLLPKNQIQNLKSGQFKDYTLGQNQKIQKDIISLTAFMDKISTGAIQCTLYNNSFSMSPASQNEFATIQANISSAKIGLTQDGQVFMLISPSDYDKIVKEHRAHDSEVGFPNYVLTQMPPNAQIILDCKRENGQWKKTNLLTKENVEQKLQSLITLKHHIGYLVNQNISFNPAQEFFQNCGKYKNFTQVFEDKNILAPQIIMARNLLEDKEGKMDQTWVENQPFFSFENYTTQRHQLVFGKKGDEYFVVDAQHNVRGSGKTKQAAIEDMAQSGFCKSGVYYYYQKDFNSTTSQKPLEILAVPKEDSWIYSAIKKTSMAAQVGYFVPSGIGQGIAIAGTITGAIFEEADRRDRAFHLGRNHKWQPGEAESLAANISFIGGAAFGMGRFTFLSQFPRLTRAAQLTGFGGFGGFMIMGLQSESKAFTQSMIDQYNQVGQPLSVKQEVPKNWNEATAQLSDLFYIISEKYIQIPKNKIDELIRKAYVPLILAAYKQQQPLGLEKEEVAYAELMLLASRISWLKNNIETLKTMSNLTGWYQEDIALEILLFGGPQIEKNENYTKELIEHSYSRYNSFVFEKAAEFLSMYSDKYNFPPSKQKISDDLKMGWLRGDIKTSDIYNWAKAQMDFEIKYEIR